MLIFIYYHYYDKQLSSDQNIPVGAADKGPGLETAAGADLADVGVTGKTFSFFKKKIKKKRKK